MLLPIRCCHRGVDKKMMCAMSEHIWIWKVLCCLLIVNISYQVDAFSKYSRSNEICSVNNGKRIYLELGDKGVLKATNITVPSFLNNKPSKESNQTLIQFQCSLDVVTCPSCVIKVSIRSMNFTKNCYAMDPSIASLCKCDYLHLSEPPYDAFGKPICGQINQYTTRTRTLSIKYFYQNNNNNVFELTYESERNSVRIVGNPNYSNLVLFEQQPYKTMTSPFFPALYPRDYATEHVIQCNITDKNVTNACRIRVIFTDFQIALDSTIEFNDSNGEQIDVFTGSIFRPPIIISSGPSLMLRFNANGATGMGYRAIIHFVTEYQLEDGCIRPDTNCGGHVEMMGGAITMMNMVTNDTEPRLYDCVWLIRPPISYSHLKTHISLRVDSFDKMGSKSILTIKQGMTSDRPDMETIIASQSTTFPAKTFVVPMTSGFYVTLRGSFNHDSVLALVYTTFSYMNCYVGSEFLCQNHRCIPIQLQCDGFDHCGDNSDEPESCSMEWSEQDYDRKWYSHTPNYFFPKIERYPDLKTATIVFFASSLGLIVLISALIVLLYKTSTRVRHQRELQNHLQTISELLDNTSRQEELPPEEPPAYEAPPDYEEVIKVGMENQINRKETRRKSNRRRSRSRLSNSNSSYWSTHNVPTTHLEVILPPETPSSSRALLSTPNPEHYPHPINADTYLSRFDDEFITARLLENATEYPKSNTPNSGEYQTSSLLGSSSQQHESLCDGTGNQSTIKNKYDGESIEALAIQSSSHVPPSYFIETGLPYDTIKQHLWNERARVRKLWLNFDSDDTNKKLQTDIISTINFHGSMRYAENNISSTIQFDSPQPKIILHSTQCNEFEIGNSVTDSKSLEYFSGGPIPSFDNFLDPPTIKPENYVQQYSFKISEAEDNEGNRSLQRSLSMDFATHMPESRRKTLNKSYSDLFNFNFK